MRELLKLRNLKECDLGTVVVHCRVLPPVPSPRFAPHRALLGYVQRKSKEGPRDLCDVTRNNT
jgi:hypothetical protein